MQATVFSGAIYGVQGLTVEVEVDLARGIPMFSIVGLPNTAVRESRERVTAAIKNSGLEFPLQRITVNLAPADIKKEGAAFDLAIAMGIIMALARKKADAGDTDDASGSGSERPSGDGASSPGAGRTIFLGELALSGLLRPVRGVLPVLLHAKAMGFERAVIPDENFAESLHVDGVEVFGCRCLADAIAVEARDGETALKDLAAGHVAAGDVRIKGAAERLRDGGAESRGAGRSAATKSADGGGGPASVIHSEGDGLDMIDVVGQEAAKRALLIAAAGGHHVLMIGPPGSGKTMLARRFPSILPPLGEAAALETTMIYSTAGLLNGAGLVERSPFRAPHHSASDAGLIGGGTIPRPGEVTLAHNGVLFLDELPEFKRHVLETLREPLEEGRIVISRARHSVTFPARFQLIAAMNPCPCGNRGNPQALCHCAPAHVDRYLGKISGPLLDRISIQLTVRPADIEAFGRPQVGHGESKSMRERVRRARHRQRHRAGHLGVLGLNARLPEKELRRHARLDSDAEALLAAVGKKLRISARGRNHVIRVARTIADLEGATSILLPHIQEAVQYRMRELRR